VLAPAKTLKAQRILLGLTRRRVDHPKLERTTTVVPGFEVSGPVEVRAGERRDLPFTLTVPADAIPTLETARHFVVHRLHVVADRRMRSDLQAARQIVVASPAG